MSRLHLASLIVLALVIGVGAEASAQTLEAPRARQGYYVAVGAHGTVHHYREDGEGLGTQVGGGGSIGLGQLLTRRFGLGLAFDVFHSSGNDQSVTVFDLGFTAQVELVRDVALRGGIGMGVVIVSSPDDDEGELRGLYGAAYTIGLTYDRFLGSRRSGGWAITPGIQLRAVPDETDDSYAVLFGVELTRWSGLPRGQLDLPNDEAFR